MVAEAKIAAQGEDTGDSSAEDRPPAEWQHWNKALASLCVSGSTLGEVGPSLLRLVEMMPTPLGATAREITSQLQHIGSVIPGAGRKVLRELLPLPTNELSAEDMRALYAGHPLGPHSKMQQ